MLKKNLSCFWMCMAMALLVATMTSMPAHADSFVINDGYVGGTPSSASYYGHDVIGNLNYFDTTKMTVSYEISTGFMTVDIISTYFDNVGKYSTQLGDLFISSDGWNPFGSAPYNDDNYTNGEDWEYALVLDDHLASSGALGLYAITPADIITSDVAYGANIYRQCQEVLVAEQDNPALDMGSWSISGTTLHLEVNAGVVLADMIDNPCGERYLGFHYAMTCGNDVIEGKAKACDVPEPSAMALLAFSLLGIYRKKTA